PELIAAIVLSGRLPNRSERGLRDAAARPVQRVGEAGLEVLDLVAGGDQPGRMAEDDEVQLVVHPLHGVEIELATLVGIRFLARGIDDRVELGILDITPKRG